MFDMQSEGGRKAVQRQEAGLCWPLRDGYKRSPHQMLLLLGVLVLFVPVTVPCPQSCSCSQTTVICTGQGLTRIPIGIPTDTQRLDLQENKISVVRRDDLAALRQLKILQLMDNQIHMIEENAFDNLLQLERL
ncbi:unnamed protein product [Anisakis simplex]|uniref:LRRNT domain-containing protein n=1 Tax=Anisakis simplex TaxID=6269 RepID=A0A0M3JWQ7_ANISI|nr:unnamed protein product [Anisakis simplex]